MKRNPILRVTGLWLLASGFSHAILDTNNNGLSDFWERQHNGDSLFDESFDPQADPDSDGWTNAQEAAAGTDPFDPNPPDGLIHPGTGLIPALWSEPDEFNEIHIITPETVAVSWPTLVGKEYTLFFSPDLEPGNWLPVGLPFTASGGVATYGFDTGAAEKCFWRVSAQDADADGEGLTDHEEFLAGTDPALPDTDGDTHTDLDELIAGTNPLVADTDGDGLPDDWEDANGLDPNDPADANLDEDGDGYGNLAENAFGSDPNVFDIGIVNPGIADDLDEVAIMLSFRGPDPTDPSNSSDPYHPSDLYHQDDVPGWQADIGEYIEVWDEGDGNPYIELQAHWDAHGIKQEFNLPPGASVNYILRYKGRYYWDAYDNAFTLEVEGASEFLVNGSAASDSGDVRSHAFMESDDGEEWAEWQYASITITAPTGGTELKQLTLSFVPTNTTLAGNGITYGGFVDLMSVAVEDNEIATGVDTVSRTVSFNDPGFQEDFWIMAPLQGPGSFTYENLTKFCIKMGGQDVGILSCENATPDTDTGAGVSTQLSLNGELKDVLWQGTGSGVDSEKTVKMKINGSQTETGLSVKVKAMKHRTVNVTVYKIADDLLTGTPEGIIDADLIPTELQLENYLNEIYGRQVNTWFDVAIKEEQVETPVDHDPNGKFDYGIDDHSRDQRDIALDAIDQAGAASANTNITLYLLGTYKQIDNPTAVGAANILERTCWVKAKVNNSAREDEEMDELLATIAHEFGHILIGAGHPSEIPGSNKGPAPLAGTRHIDRLMWAHANKPLGTPNIIVKTEWDKTEEWLKANVD